MDGCCILQWGVYETEFNVSILLYANIEKIFLHCFNIPQMVHTGGRITRFLSVIFIQLEPSLRMELFAIF